MRKTTAGIAAAAAAAFVAGCTPAPERGTVTNTQHTEAWVQIIPGAPPICSGNPPICTPGMPMQVIPWPEAWSVEITAPNGDHGWRDVSQAEYQRCPAKSAFPECTARGDGHA